MTSVFKSTALAVTAFVFSATVALAQAGGPDVPSNAKAQGTKENGSSTTGMSQGEAAQKTGSGSMQKSGGSMAPAAGDKGTATGGAAGGPASKN